MFEWEPLGEEVSEQMDALPRAAMLGLVATMDALMFSPFEFGLAPGEVADKDRKPTRTLAFDPAGLGLVTVQVYEPGEVVYIVKVMWAG